jgi:hypothetical protein
MRRIKNQEYIIILNNLFVQEIAYLQWNRIVSGINDKYQNNINFGCKGRILDILYEKI